MFLKLKNIYDFEILALEKGWANYPPIIYEESIGPVRVYSAQNKDLIIPPKILQKKEKQKYRINQEALICCNNFGIIIEGSIYPFGFSHSPVWLDPETRRISQNEVHIRVKKTSIKNYCGQDFSVFGVTNHWGHFFVDALDRIESLNKRNSRFINSGDHFLGFNSNSNQNGIIPQVAQLINELGYEVNAEKQLATIKDGFYLVDSLEYYNLQSHKPSISSRSFINFRDTLLSKHEEKNLNNNDAREILYMGRKGQSKRKIVNEEAIEMKISHYSGVTIDLGNQRLDDLVSTFSNAKVIIFIIGSSKFNLLFCKPGTKVICVVPDGYSSDGGVATMVRHICSALSLILIFYEVPIVNKSEIALNSDLGLLPSDIDTMILLLSEM